MRISAHATLICVVLTLQLNAGMKRSYADEGFMAGTYRCMKSDIPEVWKVREMPFVFACDNTTCLLGSVIPDDKKREVFLLATKGNHLVISAEVLREAGRTLELEGDWTVNHLVEQTREELDDSFESRYRVTQMAKFQKYSLPILLSWETVGVSREEMRQALDGKGLSVENQFGTLEISGNRGIGRIRNLRASADLFGPDGKSVSDVKSDRFSKGLRSIDQIFTFIPERMSSAYEPFLCRGEIECKDESGRSYQAVIEIDVTKQGSPKEARRFIDAFIAKLPNDKAIISRSEVTTVLDKGKQKVAVDLDVARAEPAKFSNQSSFGYYALVGLGLIVVGFLAFYRWSK